MNADLSREPCVVLFSGGTDSTCAAALAAEKHSVVHLLTFHERTTENSPLPHDNVSRLRAKYGKAKFIHVSISTDALVARLSYERYMQNFLRHGFFVISTPGFSSLSWHARSILYCNENGIRFAYDGMTQELLHLPGHLPEVRLFFTELYQKFGIAFASPVIDWGVPPDQRFMDRLIVDRHGFAASSAVRPSERTTGTWLFKNGILPHANVKGSMFDHRMQHDCYPFVVYNIFVFWFAIPIYSWARCKIHLSNLFKEKTRLVEIWLRDSDALRSELFAKSELLEPSEAR